MKSSACQRVAQDGTEHEPTLPSHPLSTKHASSSTDIAPSEGNGALSASLANQSSRSLPLLGPGLPPPHLEMEVSLPQLEWVPLSPAPSSSLPTPPATAVETATVVPSRRAFKPGGPSAGDARPLRCATTGSSALSELLGPNARRGTGAGLAIGEGTRGVANGAGGRDSGSRPVAGTLDIVRARGDGVAGPSSNEARRSTRGGSTTAALACRGARLLDEGEPERREKARERRFDAERRRNVPDRGESGGSSSAMAAADGKSEIGKLARRHLPARIGDVAS